MKHPCIYGFIDMKKSMFENIYVEKCILSMHADTHTPMQNVSESRGEECPHFSNSYHKDLETW